MRTAPRGAASRGSYVENHDGPRPEDLLAAVNHMWDVSAHKLRSLLACHDPAGSSPVFTEGGRYTSRAWTDWTEGFLYGSALLQFDATGDGEWRETGVKGTREAMPRHLTDFGVHDHGFNIVSTYGNLWRLGREGRIPFSADEERHHRTALMVSGAVQARRWTRLDATEGFIYSFNGPHSLFVDTLRTLRSLMVAHLLGQSLRDEAEREVSLLDRALAHARATARYSVYYGNGRDIYDLRGRVSHEAIFNIEDGSFRCPGTQQGYSPFSTWARGLAWAMLGFVEQLELVSALQNGWRGWHGPSEPDVPDDAAAMLLGAARATCDYYIDGATAADGIPYWDTGAPGLHSMGAWQDAPADPYSDIEPVDSSAAAIAAQALLRLGHHLGDTRYTSAGLSVASVLLQPPYLSTDRDHQGLLLHSVYHRPRGWDHIPAGRQSPCGESSMWGDYHLRELALLIGRLARGDAYPTFFALEAAK